MSSASQFFGGDPIGTIKMGIGLDPTKWIPCDGRKVARAAWPKLSENFPVGAYTGTARALVDSTSHYSVTASPTYFVATGAFGSSQGIQYSADGATWSKTSVSHTSGTPSNVCWAGGRFIATFGDAVRPHVTSGDNPNSTWIATTGGPDTYTPMGDGTAYSPELGRAVAINATQAFTLDNGSTTWTARSTTGLANAYSICWTGSRFLIAKIVGASLFSSADGITWSSAAVPLPSPSTQIVSNGAGVVVAPYPNNHIQVSTDHGNTWAVVLLPGCTFTANTTLSFSGGIFFAAGSAGNFYTSTDGVNWQIQTTAVQGNTYGRFAKKGTSIVGLYSGAGTTAYSFTESSTEFCAPFIQDYTLLSGGASAQAIPTAPYYIKGA